MRLPRILLSLLVLCPVAAAAQEKPQLLFLGSTHLANHNRDVANVHVDDVLVPARQAEIKTLVDHLARFKPTHVAVEWPASKQAALDQRYAAYLAGTYQLTADETDQIGLRLAKQAGLPRVDAVDWNDDAPGSDADYDYAAWAKAHGKAAQYDSYVAHWKDFAARETEFLKDHTVSEWYGLFNDPAKMREDGAGYFDMAFFGDDTKNPGAAWVGQWYARNLRIFTHIRTLATKPGDRVFVVYGAGHGPFLKKDAVESGVFTLVELQPYLK